MNILGINSFFEHPSVALIRDGELTFAMEDERLTGIKHGKCYSPYHAYVPFASMHEALDAAGIRARDVDEIAYSYSTRDHLRSLWGCLLGRRLSPLSEELAAYRSAKSVPRLMRSGHEMPERYRSTMSPEEFRAVKYTEWNHHLSHAASAFFCSGFDEALVVVSDGSGEHACTSVYEGRGRALTRRACMSLPDSLGLFYSLVTKYLGFQPFSDEYKVMALAAYGTPRYAAEFKKIVELRPQGRYAVDIRRLLDLSRTFGPAHRSGEEPTQDQFDIARSAQGRLEEVVEHLVSFHLRDSKLKRLCVAGGTFLNCVVNGRLARMADIEELFVQPAAHDAGTAVGAAALSWIRRGGHPQIRYSSMCLGTAYDEEQIQKEVKAAGSVFVRLDERDMIERIADRLANEEIGAMFRGRMEFGPRALGMRSVLASPRRAGTRERLNAVKSRENFRPVAPLVTEEAFASYFEGRPNGYMLLTCAVRPAVRDRIPAAVHVDGSARVQVVSERRDPFLHGLLRAFERRTGLPVIINTSFNSRGKPIVENPTDALSCFYTSTLDFLALGSFLVDRARHG